MKIYQDIINSLSIIKIKKFVIFLLYLLLYQKLNDNSSNTKNDDKFSHTTYFKITNNLDYCKLFDIKYFYSFKYKTIKIEYNFEFYESNNNLILPSDIALYKNLHIFCQIELNNSNTIINSFPDIVQNRNFKCIEYFNINENIKFGIKIFETNKNEEFINNYIIYFYSGGRFNCLSLFNKNDIFFDPLIINRNYIFEVTNKIFKENLKLQKSYEQAPKCIFKNNLIFNNNQWNFGKIFNEYFCFSKGLKSLNLKNSQSCKYYFYIYLIDKNRKVYLKTDFLFIDFIFKDLTSDDAYPIFKEMIKEKFPVHYLTESPIIYNEYCCKINTIKHK